MSITLNGNTAAVNWESLLGKIGDITKTAGVDGAAGTTNVTITMAVDGVATPVTIKIPDDLELPETVDQAAIDSLCKKLSADTGFNLSDEQIAQFRDLLTNTLNDLVNLSSTPPSSTQTLKGAMFDIYKMMALLVEVAQKQRDAQREMRLSENLSVQKSILDQAEAQQMAAKAGMIGGLICCALQTGATLYALNQQSNAFKAQLGTDKTAGLDVARQNVDMIKSANTHENALAQLEKVTVEVGGKPSLNSPNTTVRTKVENSLNSAEFARDNTRFTDANKKLTETRGLVSNLRSLSVNPDIVGSITMENLQPLECPEIADIKVAVQKLEAYKTEWAKMDHIQGLTQADKEFLLSAVGDDGGGNVFKLQELYKAHPGLNNVELDTAKLRNLGIEGKSITQLTTDVKTALDNKVAELQPKVEEGGALCKELAEAKKQLRSQIKIEVGKFETAYESELQNFKEVSKTGSKAQIEAAEKRLATAADELKYARALGNERLMANDLTGAEDHLKDITDARSAYIDAQHTRANSVDYIKASNTINTAQAQNNLIAAIGGFLQSGVGYATQFIQAEATKQGAQQKKAEEELDQTRDLFNQAEELVNSIVKLMQAVIGAETQSMRDAIQA